MDHILESAYWTGKSHMGSIHPRHVQLRAETNSDRATCLLTRRDKWLESRQSGFSLTLESPQFFAKLYFFQSGQESKVIATMLFVSSKEGMLDVVAFCLEHLDTGELLIEPEPREIIHPKLDDSSKVTRSSSTVVSLVESTPPIPNIDPGVLGGHFK
jgi:hypothetical protein